MRKVISGFIAAVFLLLTPDASARFVSTDPVQANPSTGQNFNRYNYANNNPYRFTDPDGRQAMGAPRDFYNPVTAEQAKQIAPIVADFTPVVGDVKGVVDAIRDPTPANIAGAAAGLVPIVGDLGKQALKHGDEAIAIAKAMGDGGKSAPDFVVSPGGTAFPVPRGAEGPTPVINPSGQQTGVAFTGGNGGANGQVSTMRIMDPTSPRGASPGYPNGYIKYENSGRQGVDPYSGGTLPNSQSHHRIDP